MCHHYGKCCSNSAFVWLWSTVKLFTSYGIPSTLPCIVHVSERSSPFPKSWYVVTSWWPPAALGEFVDGLFASLFSDRVLLVSYWKIVMWSTNALFELSPLVRLNDVPVPFFFSFNFFNLGHMAQGVHAWISDFWAESTDMTLKLSFFFSKSGSCVALYTKFQPIWE